MKGSGQKSFPEGIRPAPYQLVGTVKLALSGVGGILLCDGVGVGKTISAGYAARYFFPQTKGVTVVVSPVMLVDKWRFELRAKFGFDTRPVRSLEELGTAEEEVVHNTQETPVAYVVANSLLGRKGFKSSLRPGVLIFDEIHNYRNPETNAFAAAQSFAGQANLRIGLTATPINNTLMDLASELAIILPHVTWDSVAAVVNEVWQAKRFSTLSPVLTRFDKKALGIHFANRSIETHRANYDTRYSESVLTLIRGIRGRSNRTGMFFDEITLFRLAASSPLAFGRAVGKPNIGGGEDRKVAILLEILERYPAEHVIVFCEFRDTVEYIASFVTGRREVFAITGDTPFSERAGVISNFRRLPGSVLLLTAVGSEGLDMQFCSHLVNYDLHWNPMILEQRIGRIDRIGQDKPEVMVHNILVAGSVDERVLAVLSRKLIAVAQSVLAPQPVIETMEESADTALVDDDVLSEEQSKSSRLLAALTRSSDIKLNDFLLVEAIPPRFCDPLVISELGASKELPVATGPVLARWKEEFRGAAADFISILSEYT